MAERLRRQVPAGPARHSSHTNTYIHAHSSHTSPLDIDKIFATYGVDSTYPGRSKVITIESVPISEYWFKMIFLGEMRLQDSLYEWGKPMQVDKQEVLDRLRSACACLRDPHVQWPEGASRDARARA